MTGGGQEQLEPKVGGELRHLLGTNHSHELFTKRNNKSYGGQFQSEYMTQQNNEFDKVIEGNGDIGNLEENYDNDEEDDDFSTEALLAVSSAEEYAAKIIKLQQACLTPLKEDLADWLNKIMNLSSITKENFMDKLDNGVIICKMAKIISLWCEQQLTNSNSSYDKESQQDISAHNRANSQFKLDSLNKSLNPLYSQNESSTAKLSNSTFNVHTPSNIHDDTSETTHINNDVQVLNYGNKVTSETVIATPLKHYQHSLITSLASRPLRSSSQSTNCLTSSSAISLNGSLSLTNRFLSNLNRMHQTKIWEDAKCRTFYARDNVCNFIKWSKEFGVNQSVLFESDDLVLHANPRQVVLCLLDVARIACVKHGFTEAPGLVKFEQEIDRELAAAEKMKEGLNPIHDESLSSDTNKLNGTNGTKAINKKSSPSKSFRSGSIVDPLDDLIMRYCLHKEKAAESMVANANSTKTQEEEKVSSFPVETTILVSETLEEPALDHSNSMAIETTESISSSINSPTIQNDETSDQNLISESELSSLTCNTNNITNETQLKQDERDTVIQENAIIYGSRVDSLDSGEGRTESASTSHTSRTPVNNVQNPKTPRNNGTSMIPTAIKRSSSSSSLTSNHSSSIGTPSKLSSSRSSLFSGQESSSTTKHHITSDLDGKVMRIAKSYYGKGATKGVTRLSEGKYKIADRIVFVRLLKGHRVMVRIGGGWDTLENFLFRHKSDPSQVIDVDNLLPLETKMNFEKTTPQTTPTNTKFSKLPYYRRSGSASASNLSISNLSVSNHSSRYSQLRLRTRQ